MNVSDRAACGTHSWRPIHLAIVAVGLTTAGRAVRAQQCDTAHFRWPAKVSLALLRQPPDTTTIAAMLTRWSVPNIWPGRDSWCAARVDRERSVYSVLGWLRDADTTKDDGDWHLELTQRRDDAREQCIVVEIPAPRWGRVYATARATVDTLLRASRWGRHGRVDPPVRIRVIGPAFYDAEHVRGRRRPRAEGHGHCNSSLLALWEIHPVYRVERVERPGDSVAAQGQKGNPLRK